MWYAFIPDYAILQDRFCGRTDNLFLFRTYVDMMTKLKVRNILDRYEFKTEEECMRVMMDRLESVISYDNGEPLDFIVDAARLSSFHSNSIDQTPVVTSDFVYEQFHEIVYDEREIDRAMRAFYTNISSPVVRILSCLRPTELAIVTPVLKRLSELWDEYGSIYKREGAMGMLRMRRGSFDIINGTHANHSNPYIWCLFDETKYLKLWMVMEIVGLTRGGVSPSTFRDF